MPLRLLGPRSIAALLTPAPLAVFFCTFFWYTPLYFMLGLTPNAGKYFTFMLIMGQNLAVWIGIGQTASAYFPTADVAQLVLGCLSPLMFMFCGVFLQKSLCVTALRL